ncbi:hypothetical protein SLA2020_180620 [Shorea laevis]
MDPYVKLCHVYKYPWIRAGRTSEQRPTVATRSPTTIYRPIPAPSCATGSCASPSTWTCATPTVTRNRKLRFQIS